LQWLLEGSTNGIDWFPVHSQNTDYDYTNAKPFYTPGIFPLSSVDYTNKQATASTQVSGQDRIIGNIQEGFRADLLKPSKPVQTMKYVAPPVALESAYSLPLKADKPLQMNQKIQVVQKKRIQQLRFRILETQDPTSKFVNVSQLEFHTRQGVISPTCFKISNPQGSRKNPKEGVNGLLGNRSSRWVDFNKSELIIQFDTEILPSSPILGFKFSVPELSGGFEASPSKWILLGSYDKREWIPLHEQTEYKAHITGVNSPVYKIYEEI
jgi:hypothetical protein